MTFRSRARSAFGSCWTWSRWATPASAAISPRSPRPPAGSPTTRARSPALGLAGWDVIPLLVLSNAGTAELWTGDLAEAEKHLRAAVDTNQWSGLLRPHLNAASQLALLLAERGDLDAAQAEAQAAVQRATEAGWAVSAQAVAAYLALAWVSLDRSEPEGVDRWLGRVAEVEAIAPEPHVQLAAAALTALRRADAGDLEGARTGLQAQRPGWRTARRPSSPTDLCWSKPSCCAGPVTCSKRPTS